MVACFRVPWNPGWLIHSSLRHQAGPSGRCEFQAEGPESRTEGLSDSSQATGTQFQNGSVWLQICLLCASCTDRWFQKVLFSSGFYFILDHTELWQTGEGGKWVQAMSPFHLPVIALFGLCLLTWGYFFQSGMVMTSMCLPFLVLFFFLSTMNLFS